MHRRPFKQLDKMLEELSDRFEEERMELGGEIGTTAVDVAEWDGEYLVIADLPGFEPEDIDVRVEDRTVHIRAEHKAEHEPEVEHYHQRERAYRSVSRDVRLPGDVDEEAVTASFEDGVLSISLPKSHPEEHDEGRRIEIN